MFEPEEGQAGRNHRGMCGMEASFLLEASGIRVPRRRNACSALLS